MSKVLVPDRRRRAVAATPAHAQQSAADYPNKPVKVVVTVPAGGGVDTVTRIVTERLRTSLGSPS